MKQDEISQSIVAYVQQHNRPELALLPEHISQGVLDILIEDTRHMAEAAKDSRPVAGQYITLAVLLLRSQLFQSNKVQVSESELRKNIARYTQAIYLENLSRQGIIKNVSPAPDAKNILDSNVTASYDLTELGKRVTLDSLQPLPNLSE